jgi:hypothetical protein
MLNTLTRGAPGRTLGVLALVVAAVGFVGPEAAGVDVPSGHSPGPAQASPAPGGPALRGVVRVEKRDFTVAPHSLATNQLLACPGAHEADRRRDLADRRAPAAGGRPRRVHERSRGEHPRRWRAVVGLRGGEQQRGDVHLPPVRALREGPLTAPSSGLLQKSAEASC